MQLLFYEYQTHHDILYAVMKKDGISDPTRYSCESFKIDRDYSRYTKTYLRWSSEKKIAKFRLLEPHISMYC